MTSIAHELRTSLRTSIGPGQLPGTESLFDRRGGFVCQGWQAGICVLRLIDERLDNECGGRPRHARPWCRPGCCTTPTSTTAPAV